MIETKNFSLNDKLFLIRRINDIKDKKCYRDIFKFLIKQNIKYMRNSNGIFFNVGLLSNEFLTMIDFIVSFHEIKQEKIYSNNIY